MIGKTTGGQSMKFLFAIGCLLLVAVCSSQLAAARTLLECKGYSARLNGPISHEIEIDNTTAEVDGQRYHVSESATQFILTGPIPVNDTIFGINRLTGEWYINPSSMQGDFTKLEYSVDGDEGCGKADQKF